MKLKTLFLCTDNSCRSKMAEGWARYLKGDIIEPYSAGIFITEGFGMKYVFLLNNYQMFWKKNRNIL